MLQEKDASFLGMMGKRTRVAFCMKKQPKCRRWIAGCVRAPVGSERLVRVALCCKAVNDQGRCGSRERILCVNWGNLFWREEGLFWVAGESPAVLDLVCPSHSSGMLEVVPCCRSCQLTCLCWISAPWKWTKATSWLLWQRRRWISINGSELSLHLPQTVQICCW